MHYFAYGSNMNPKQMSHRCPDAVPLGPAVLRDYVLVERKFADIDRKPGKQVNGMLWDISDNNLRALDRYEGYPELYIRYDVAVIFSGLTLKAIVYEMTEPCKRERNGITYSPAYRNICSVGAAMNRIENAFEL